MYGWQTEKTLEVEYTRFSDRLRHSVHLDEPVSADVVLDMASSRLREILPTWPALADVPSPQPGDAEEARFAELYILWALSDFAQFMRWDKYDAQEKEWSRLHAADGNGRAQASSLLQRLLAEYWACPPDDRKHILQDTSALLYASASTADVYHYLKGVALGGWSKEFDASFTGFHDLRMTYAEPRLQGR
jgi:hypothetical protein